MSFPDPMYTPAMFLSFCLVVTAFHRFNERRTSTLLSILVTIPFTIITVFVRILGVAVILAFHPLQWSLLLLAGLILSLLVLNLACQSNLIEYPPSKDKDEGMAECCASASCSFILFKLPCLLLKAIVNIFLPLGYSSQTWKLWWILGTGFPVGFWLGSRILVMIPVLVANYIVIGEKPTA